MVSATLLFVAFLVGLGLTEQSQATQLAALSARQTVLETNYSDIKESLGEIKGLLSNEGKPGRTK